MRRLFIGITAVLGIAATSRREAKTGTANMAVALGTFEIRSGTSGSKIDKAALDVDNTPGTPSPEAKGDIKNQTGRTLDDVTIVIENSSSGTGDPPQGSEARISYGSGSESAGFSALPGGGYKATIAFDGGNGGISGLPDGNTATVDIELSTSGTTPQASFSSRSRVR